MGEASFSLQILDNMARIDLNYVGGKFIWNTNHKDNSLVLKRECLDGVVVG